MLNYFTTEIAEKSQGVQRIYVLFSFKLVVGVKATISNTKVNLSVVIWQN